MIAAQCNCAAYGNGHANASDEGAKESTAARSLAKPEPGQYRRREWDRGIDDTSVSNGSVLHGVDSSENSASDECRDRDSRGRQGAAPIKREAPPLDHGEDDDRKSAENAAPEYDGPNIGRWHQANEKPHGAPRDGRAENEEDAEPSIALTCSARFPAIHDSGLR